VSCEGARRGPSDGALRSPARRASGRAAARAQAQRDPTQRTLEARLRNARYLGELAKFRAAPFGGVFTMLKALLDDFAGHNVDAAAALVEAAGRFLLRLPETETRMANMLDARPRPACGAHVSEPPPGVEEFQ